MQAFLTRPALAASALTLAMLLVACGPREGESTAGNADANADAVAGDSPDTTAPVTPIDTAAAPATTESSAEAPPGEVPAPALAELLGTHHWRLDTATGADGGRIDALFANTDAPLQLDFAHGRVVVSNACNTMNGDFSLAAGELAFGPMASTKMACSAPLMDMEREAHTRLSGRHAMALEPGGPARLTLENGLGDRLVFTGSAVGR